MKKIIIFVIFLFLRCAPDAPHRPAQPGTIKGEVINMVGDSLQGSIIELFPTHKKDTTDGEGKFSFSNLDDGFYIITAKKDKYVEKAETTRIEEGEEKDVQIKLKGKPVIRTASICSEHSNRSFPNPFSEYKVKISLIFYEPNLPFADSAIAESEYEKIKLGYRASDDTVAVYDTTVSYNDIFKMDTLVGILFDFWVKSHAGEYSDSVTAVLERVIDEMPEIIFPDSGETLSKGDTLKWIPPVNILDSLHYITILKMWQNPENPIWISDTLSITDSTLVFTDSIAKSLEGTGIYDWAVEVQDRFGNCSRTIEQFYFIENVKR